MTVEMAYRVIEDIMDYDVRYDSETLWEAWKTIESKEKWTSRDIAYKGVLEGAMARATERPV